MIGSIVLGMSLVFGACGNQEGSSEESANEITVSTWNYETTPEFKALFEAFEKKTGIKVKAVDIASDDYDTKLTTMLSSGDTTDVLTMKNLLSYSNYALRDQLVDQTERIRELDTDAAEGTYEMYDIDGKTYALPYRTDFWVLYYNKKMFDDAGINIRKSNLGRIRRFSKSLVKMTDKFMEHINISGVRRSKLLQLLKTKRILWNQIIDL